MWEQRPQWIRLEPFRRWSLLFQQFELKKWSIAIDLPLGWPWVDLPGIRQPRKWTQRLTRNAPLACKAIFWPGIRYRPWKCLCKLQCRGCLPKARCRDIRFWLLDRFAPGVSICTRLFKWFLVPSGILPVIISPWSLLQIYFLSVWLIAFSLEILASPLFNREPLSSISKLDGRIRLNL